VHSEKSPFDATEEELKKSGASYVEAGLKVPEIVFDHSAYT
jgi:hypothetical protein